MEFIDGDTDLNNLELANAFTSFGPFGRTKIIQSSTGARLM